MKFVHPDIHTVFNTGEDKINTLVIENQKVLYSVLSDIQGQLQGMDGRSVLSLDDKELSVPKYMELITQFIPFTINRKPLLNKVAAALEQAALSDSHYARSMEVISEVEMYLMDVSMELDCDIDFGNLRLDALIKAAGITLKEDYEGLAEKMLDYIQLVTDFDKKKLFVVYGLRDFLSDEETFLFFDTVLRRKYDILMIESRDHKRLPNELRYIVDTDLCEIS